MQHFCNTFIEKVICNSSPLFLLPAGICIGTDACTDPERCRRRYPDTDHFSADHPWSYFHSSKYDLRYRNTLRKRSRTPYGQPGEKISGTSWKKCYFHSNLHISGICHRTVRSDDSCQKRLRIPWICGIYHIVCTVCSTCHCYKRKRDLKNKKLNRKSPVDPYGRIIRGFCQSSQKYYKYFIKYSR